ncbi:MAG TPA: hypothetical protein VK660_07225 [Xanthomonadaceae bacterium]|jgi:hypothetical protein|nr:hypothetical protein [Xanthomonadaceae bacterium]
MSIAESARNNAVQFECKKDGLQQRQSGDWVLRLTVQAIDMHQRITNAAMGARFACVLVEINDDEEPVDYVAQERDKWRALGPAKQAGIRCHDPVFWAWIEDEGFKGVHHRCANEDEAAGFVRSMCQVISRADLSKPGFSEQRRAWYAIDFAFQAWKLKESR